MHIYIYEVMYKAANPTNELACVEADRSSHPICTSALILDAYLPVSTLLEIVHSGEQFFILDWPVALCGGEGLSVVYDWMKLFASIDDMVLR